MPIPEDMQAKDAFISILHLFPMCKQADGIKQFFCPSARWCYNYPWLQQAQTGNFLILMIQHAINAQCVHNHQYAPVLIIIHLLYLFNGKTFCTFNFHQATNSECFLKQCVCNYFEKPNKFITL